LLDKWVKRANKVKKRMNKLKALNLNKIEDAKQSKMNTRILATL